MGEKIHLQTPLSTGDTQHLKVGDHVLLSGTIYTGRDMVHRRFMETLEKGEDLPFDVKGQVLFYVGPAPARPGYPIGSCGPTTSYRMDKFTPLLYEKGLRGTIGKGKRNQAVKDAIKKYQGVYFVATGGVAALLCKSIKSAKIIAYEDLAAEAVRELVVEDFPVTVGNDCYGGDIFEEGIKRFGGISK
jgi:fumarate hydratase subunit beta